MLKYVLNAKKKIRVYIHSLKSDKTHNQRSYLQVLQWFIKLIYHYSIYKKFRCLNAITCS
jgi:hypothetical protein